MIISRLGGITSDNDSALPQAENIEVLFEADDDISVGMIVGHDTGSTTGTLVVPVVAGHQDDHRFVGIYEGKGGSGSATTTADCSGNDAVDGDVILVTAYGTALALATNEGGAWVDGDPCTPSLTTAGEVCGGSSTLTAGLCSPLVALESYNDVGPEAKTCFVKCL